MSTDLNAPRIAERALIGSLLSDRDAIATVADWLKPGAFDDTLCRTLYSAVLVLWQSRIPADMVTINHGLGMNGIDLGSIDWADVTGMLAEVPVGCHAEHYARIVANAAQQRLLIELGRDLIEGSFQGDDFDYQAAYRKRIVQIESMSPESRAAQLVSYDDLVPDYQEHLLRRWSGEIQRREVPTGFTHLDRAMRGGWRPGELIIEAARPGMGKTSWALQVAHNIARSTKQRVLLFSAEMSAESLMERGLAEVSGFAPDVIDTGQTERHIRERILEAAAFMATLPISVDDTSAITTKQMLQRVQRAQKREPIGLVIFDYLELAGDTEDENETIRVGNMCKRMKHLARECDVPVLLLCQLNRNVEHRSNRLPNLSDLRQSGAIEQHADKVLFLYRHDYYVGQGLANPDESKQGTCDIIVAKNRNGATGTYTVRFYPQTMTFTDLDVNRWEATA